MSDETRSMAAHRLQCAVAARFALGAGGSGSHRHDPVLMHVDGGALF